MKRIYWIAMLVLEVPKVLFPLNVSTTHLLDGMTSVRFKTMEDLCNV